MTDRDDWFLKTTNYALFLGERTNGPMATRSSEPTIAHQKPPAIPVVFGLASSYMHVSKVRPMTTVPEEIARPLCFGGFRWPRRTS